MPTGGASGSAGLIGSINPSLQLPSTALSGTSPTTIAPGTFAPVTISYKSPGAGGSSSILYMGLFALAVIFVVRELL